MLELVSKATGFSINKMCQSNSVCNKVFKTGNYFVLDVFEALKNRYGSSLLGHLRYWLYAVRLIGLINTCRMHFGPPRPRETRLMFRVEIFSWPTPGNIDLTECRLFCIDHVANNGDVLPFLEALYKNDRLQLESIEKHSVELPDKFKGAF